MNFSERKVVALDIGGVCIQLFPEICMNRFGLKPDMLHWPDFWKLDFQVETGRISDEYFLESARKLLDNRLSIDEIRAAWSSFIGPDIPGMAGAVRSLSDRFRFVYFSNTSRLHLDDVTIMNGFGHLVTGGVFSFSAGAMKPDSAIYEVFEREYGVPYAYFDDRAENIEGAKARGWNAFLFHSPEEFRRILSTGPENEKGCPGT